MQHITQQKTGPRSAPAGVLRGSTQSSITRNNSLYLSLQCPNNVSHYSLSAALSPQCATHCPCISASHTQVSRAVSCTLRPNPSVTPLGTGSVSSPNPSSVQIQSSLSVTAGLVQSIKWRVTTRKRVTNINNHSRCTHHTRYSPSHTPTLTHNSLHTTHSHCTPLTHVPTYKHHNTRPDIT